MKKTEKKIKLSTKTKKLFFENKKYLIPYLLLAPLCCICSILFALSLEPIISAGAALDGARLGGAALTGLVLAALDMAMALLLYRTRLLLVQGCVDSLRRELMNGILARTPLDFAGQEVAGYITLFSNHTGRVKDDYFSGICKIYESIWNLALSMATLVFYSLWLGLFLLIIGLVSVYIPNLFTKSLQKKQEEQAESAERHVTLLRDILSGYLIIKNHCVEQIFSRRYGEVSRKLAQVDFQGEYYPYKVSWISSSITALSFIGVISISAYLVVRGILSASIVLSLSQLIGGVLFPLESIPQYMSRVRGSQRIFQELAAYTEMPAVPADIPDLPDDWQRMQLSGLRFNYGNTPVLRNISLELERGKKYAIIGRSGAGKSTLAKILAGIIPTSFQLTVEGVAMDAAALAAHISYMDQNVFLFHDTIYENISLYRNFDPAVVRDRLSEMQFREDLRACDDPLNIPVGEGGGQLSGGERQRVALLRELMSRKNILVLDECMSALDEATARELEEMLLGLEGITCLMIVHHLDSTLMKGCDGILSLEDGKLIDVTQQKG